MNNLFSKKYIKFIAIILLIAIFFILDRYLKFIAINSFKNTSFNLIGDFLSFTFTSNYYIAFSLPFSGPALNILIALIIIFLFSYLFYSIRKYNNDLLIVSFLLILIGAVSNFIDRVTLGYVVDYIYLKNFTVFNMADVYISCGAIISIASLNKKAISK